MYRASIQNWIYILAYVILFLASYNNQLFWDTVQFGAIHPSWYYDNHFKYFFLPEQYDSGHPITFGWYIAIFWYLFGKSLLLTHLLMIPFLILLVVQSVKLGTFFFPKNTQGAFTVSAIILFDTVLLGQSLLVSPDLVMMSFFLLTLQGVLNHKKSAIYIGAIGLCIISNRGITVCFVLYLFALFYNHLYKNPTIRFKQLVSLSLPFAIGALFWIIYQTLHYYYLGWVFYNTENTSQWAQHFEKATSQEVIRNFIILLWRMVDLGKLLWWLVMVFIIYKLIMRNGVRKLFINHKVSALWLLSLGLFLMTCVPLIFYKGLLGHRYILPFTVVVSIITVYYLWIFIPQRAWYISFAILLFLISGNLWIWPKIAHPWDSSLAQLSVYELQDDALQFIKSHKIRDNQIATTFPMRQYEMAYLKGHRMFEDWNKEKDTEYVIYSNISPGMDEQKHFFYQYYIPIFNRQKGLAELIIFKRK